MAETADLGKLKIGDFSPLLNSDFEMKVGKSAVKLKLAEAKAFSSVAKPPANPGADYVPMPSKHAEAAKKAKIVGRDGGGFTLQFVAPADARLKQGTYEIKHPKLGTLAIFLSPTGEMQGGHGYHAVFG